MQSRLIRSSIFLLCTLWLGALPSHATEYRLQLASIDESLFLRYVDMHGAPFKFEQHTLPRLLDLFNRPQEAKSLVLSDYELQPVSVPQAAGAAWEVVKTASGYSPPWTTASWEGTPGKVVVLRLRSLQRSWQGLTQVAIRTDGALRRLPVQSVPLFGRTDKLAVPAMGNPYIQNTLERGTFLERVAPLAASHTGLSLFVGRNHDSQFPDSVYFLIRQPETTQTYTVVFGWENRERFERDGGNTGGPALN